MFVVVVGPESLVKLGPFPTTTQGDFEEGPFRSGGSQPQPRPSACLRSAALGAEQTAWEPVCQPVSPGTGFDSGVQRSWVHPVPVSQRSSGP